MDCVLIMDHERHILIFLQNVLLKLEQAFRGKWGGGGDSGGRVIQQLNCLKEIIKVG